MPNVPAGVTGVVFNLTATNMSSPTFVSACPAAQAVSECARTSMVNASPGVNIANQVTVPIAADGKVRLYNDSGGVDLVADLAGYFTGGLVAAGPTRVLDTRTGSGAPAGRVGPGGVLTVTMPNVPAGATGVVFNLTATNMNSSTFVSACPAAQPVTECAQTSTVNANPGVNIANQVTVPIASDGKVRLYNNIGDVDMVADLAGFVTSS